MAQATPPVSPRDSADVSPSDGGHVRLSDYGKSCSQPSPVSQLMQDFSRGFRVGVDVNLGVGYVNEDTIPAQTIAEAFHHVATHPEQYPHAFNYGESKGSQRLDGALRRFFVRHSLGGYTQESLSKREFAIGANGATSLLYAFAQVMPRGVVITSDPNYYIYSNALRRLGFTLRTLPEDDDGIDVDALETVLQTCADDVSFVYIVTIGNPSAAILSNSRRERIVRAVTALSRRLGRKVPLVFDEAYEWLLHDGAAPPEPAASESPAESPNPSVQSPLGAQQQQQQQQANAAFEAARAPAPKPDVETLPLSGSLPSGALLSGPLLSGVQWDELGLVYELGTLSKVLAPSLRIGFVLGPPGQLLDALVQCTNDIGFSAPLINQEACAHLLDTIVDDHVRAVRAGYRAKATLVKAALDRHLSAWLEHCVGGRAGFYYYLTLQGIETHAASAFYAHCSGAASHITAAPSDNAALDQTPPRVIYLPGNLCVDPDGVSAEVARRQMRLSFGFSSNDELERGIDLLGQAARYAKDIDSKLTASALAKPALVAFLEHAAASYARAVGKPLVPATSGAELVTQLARARFVFLSHDTQPQPVYTFGNALALQLWEMTWDEFTSLPSNRCAEPMHREQREQFLREVAERGVACGYSGVRISKTGRRFRIEDVTCWNVTDSHGTFLGQAACYPRWTFL